MANREKGSATVACPTCGKDLAVKEQPDGGMAAVTCSSCHPKTEKAAERVNRERGTDAGSVENPAPAEEGASA